MPLKTSVEHGIAEVLLDHPPVNALDSAGWNRFAEIIRKRSRRGVFTSVVELQMPINGYLDYHNTDPKPFVWTASASSIIEKVNRGKQSLESQH